MTQKYLALIGDIISLAIVTLVGFSSHGTLRTAGPRMFSTFLPLLLGWVLIATLLALYDRAVIGDVRQLWRPLVAMVFAAPLAAWMRGLWLGSPIQPVFVGVMIATTGVAMTVWRGLYLVFLNMKRQSYG